MSYTERLAAAAKLQEEKKKPAGITHKARAPVTEKKEWQKKLEASRQQQAGGSVADRKSKSPGALSGGEKSTLAKKAAGKDMGKAGPLKKPGVDNDRRTSVAKGKASDKARPVEPPIKRKRSPSPISWRGRNAAAAPVKKASRPRHGRNRYDEDDEDDDWIVDDDEEEGGGYRQRYRYAESEDESDSDMEAAGLDILEEEERSRRNAIKEDIEQERLEKELAARKAAMKKKLGKK
ncbi:hypothetical protein FN846DRAFT_277763 [Sphaerosporella brunnea]|uniref:SPT2 chromatin protein-domain-containing protein n=1 Tax=Sphaerosporella brunnea TaxID=1250544 RepID=A0A5J5EM37_9PEZI|nr:hypothetical protein FN846DRAFT_277763 [Sphaerosporella brunnea]